MNETSSIEGTLLMLDGLTPHVVVPVQAIQDGKVIATVLSGCSTQAGKYYIDNLKSGPYRLRCQVPDGYVYYRAEGEAQWVRLNGSEETGDIIHVGSGEALSNMISVKAIYAIRSFKKLITIPLLSWSWQNWLR
jgi:hypothetical protein